MSGSRNNRHPFDDFFNDSFGRFDRIHDEMINDMFRIFGGGPSGFDRDDRRDMDDNFSSAPPDYPPSSNHNNSRPSRPHLSLINPEINAPQTEKRYPNENDNNNYYQNRNQTISPFSPNNFFFRHFPFGPEYGRPRIGDVNPEYRENRRIFNDNNPHPGIRDPDMDRPQLPSPYLPNAQGNEVDIPIQSYYQSTVVVTLPDGQTKKITTINENGHVQTTEEIYGRGNDGHHNQPEEDDVFRQWTPFGNPWHTDSIFRDRTRNPYRSNRDEMINDTPNSNSTQSPNFFQRFLSWIPFLRKYSSNHPNHTINRYDIISTPNEENLPHDNNFKSTPKSEWFWGLRMNSRGRNRDESDQNPDGESHN